MKWQRKKNLKTRPGSKRGPLSRKLENRDHLLVSLIGGCYYLKPDGFDVSERGGRGVGKAGTSQSSEISLREKNDLRVASAQGRTLLCWSASFLIQKKENQ